MTRERSWSNSRLADVGRLPAGALSVGLLYFLTLIIASDGAWSTVISGLFPALFLSPAMALLAWRNGWHRFEVVPGTAPIGVALVGFCIFGTASTLLNPLPEDGWLPLLACYVMPIMLYYAVSVQRLTAEQLRRVLLYVAAGALVPLIWGAWEFYHEWGVPTGVELLQSRYDLVRMGDYMAKTFGNTGNMAAFLAIVMPTAGAALVTYWRRRAMRRVLVCMLLVAMVHVLIVQSRTLFIVLALAFPVIAIFYRLRFGVAFFLLIAALGAVVIPVLTAVNEFFESTVGAASGLNEDNSVSERLEAMQFALRILEHNYSFGVGPGNSLLHNPYTSAHEYILQQGSEIGAIGILLAALLTAAVAARVLVLFFRRATDPHARARFAMMIGPATYLAYGVIANMPLAENVETPWIGLTALLAGASFARVTPSRAEPEGRS